MKKYILALIFMILIVLAVLLWPKDEMPDNTPLQEPDTLAPEDYELPENNEPKG